MITVIQKNYTSPPVNQKEILRYLRVGTLDDKTQKIADECVVEFSDNAVYKVCYAELPITVLGDICDFGVFTVKSHDLSKNLSNTKKVIAFAATVGIGIDRLINKYSRISPAKAVVFDAIGSERIETLCDRFCEDIKSEFGNLKPRFSAGYGDLPIQTQKELFSILQCDKKIGLTLNDSYMMSPSKSVSAFIGII